jgi:hypothetical protein
VDRGWTEVSGVKFSGAERTDFMATILPSDIPEPVSSGPCIGVLGATHFGIALHGNDDRNYHVHTEAQTCQKVHKDGLDGIKKPESTLDQERSIQMSSANRLRASSQSPGMNMESAESAAFQVTST